MLGIRDFLVRIRIRLLSSVTLRMKKKYFFIFFSCNLPAGTLSSVFKAKRGRLKKTKILYCKCFLEFNLAIINGLGGFILSKKVKTVVPYSTPLGEKGRIQIRSQRRIRIHTADYWIRIWIQEAPKHADPDPQQCKIWYGKMWPGGTCSGELAGLAAAVCGGVEASPGTLGRTQGIREAVY